MNPADKDLRLRYLETEQIYRLNLFVIVTGGGRPISTYNVADGFSPKSLYCFKFYISAHK